MIDGATRGVRRTHVGAMSLVAAACCAVLSFATISTVATASAASTSLVVRPCSTAQLVVWVDTSGGGAAAGSTYYRLEFTNEGSSSCSLYGYPGVSAIDLAGHQLGAPAGRNPQTPKKDIAIAAGVTATSVVQITDTGVYSNASCKAVWAAGLRIYPPSQTVAKAVPLPFHACSSSAEIDLHVEAVEKGILPQ